MIHFAKWKVTLVLGICLLGLVFAAPNFLASDDAEALPTWLPHKQISLGLDLQGGSHLLLEVEVAAVIEERLEALVDSVRGALRQARIRYRNLGQEGNGIRVSIIDLRKLDEAVRMIRGDGGEVDASLDDGVILATWLDLYNTGDLYQAGDNLRQNGLMLTWARSEADWGGWRWRDFALTGAMVRLANDDFDTGIWAMPFIARARVGPIGFEANVSHIRGATRELSEGMSVLNPRPAASQKLRSLGARAIVDWTVGPTTLTFEFDYASGDDDPRQESDLTSFSYPRDLNVGLLLFERILAFESARRAAVGVENLHNLSAPSFPLTEVSTETRFTNALALFPQVNVEWIDRPEHLFSTRFGVLLAWPAAAGGAVDPVMTSLSEDGERIDDDAVNFHGGDPGSYYGTEFDFQLRWAYRSGFFWTVESAALLPGSSLRDENNDAVPSFMVENRFEFVF